MKALCPKLGHTERATLDQFRPREAWGRNKNRLKSGGNSGRGKNEKICFLRHIVGNGLLAGFAAADTLADVKARGELNCGSNAGLAGFSAPDANGVYQGFDVAMCRAIAAAVLGDGMKVKVVPLSSETRFTALSAGEVDLLSRTTTWTYSRDTDLKLDFVGVSYYDGQGFMVKKSLGVSSAKELDGATVCIQTGTTTELNLADYFKANGITYEPVPLKDNAEAEQQYSAGSCDVYTTDSSGLAATRATFKDPSEHIILPEIISKEPLSLTVRHGDNNWGDIVRWTFNALLTAEEFGITAANVKEMAAAPGPNPEINRLLGTEGELGAMMGLDKDWAVRAIAAGGNYGEIFEATIGASTPIGLSRGLNALWTQGGLQYSPPFR